LEEMTLNTVPTFEDLLNAQDELVKAGQLTDIAAQTRKSRVGKLVKVLGDEVIYKETALIISGSFDEEDFTRRYRNRAFTDGISIGKDEPGDHLNRLRSMIKAYQAYISGDYTKLQTKPRRPSTGTETAVTRPEEHSREHSIISTSIPSPGALERSRGRSNVDVKASLNQECVIMLAVADSMPSLSMDEKMAFHRTMERIADSQTGLRTFGLVKFGMQNTGDEDC
jgi:hypothetical protein